MIKVKMFFLVLHKYFHQLVKEFTNTLSGYSKKNKGEITCFVLFQTHKTTNHV